ncbi:MAG: hypothetical protein ABFR97_12035 [Thermodesulfobacteriota bacterium]
MFGLAQVEIHLYAALADQSATSERCGVDLGWLVSQGLSKTKRGRRLAPPPHLNYV